MTSRFWQALILSINIVACAANPSLDPKTPASDPPEVFGNKANEAARQSEKLIKSPHGYVINGPKGSFGGFIGDCASDENFPYYWECMEENSGDSYN